MIRNSDLLGLFRDNDSTSDFPEQRIHVVVDSCQDRVSIERLYIQISTQIVDDILYHNIKAEIAVIHSKL